MPRGNNFAQIFERFDNYKCEIVVKPLEDLHQSKANRTFMQIACKQRGTIPERHTHRYPIEPKSG